MKYKCEICQEEKETNDCILELQINLSEVDGEELGDFVHSPIYSEKICSSCAKWLSAILHRGFKAMEDKE
ncbi:MAG: hypothetical protein KKF48_02660 [Nanoarchaeota archaeon]|nr:hypothetical protein [Nanoarchaeota archaeon]MBU1027923.1 hypothetical protein [Nanoarchaeota archaeon]